MKICVAQTRPVKGDIRLNVENHKKMINIAAAESADLIVFPELSLTGYEPTLARGLAIDPNDDSLDDFQTLSDSKNITIAVGMPTVNNGNVSISLIFFQPHKARRIYSKKYLHADEEPFFKSGESFPVMTVTETVIAPVICYELFIPEHSTLAHENGAEIYLASVANTAGGMERAAKVLSEVARKYGINVLLANHVGHCDNFESAGGSAVWDEQGQILAQLGDTEEGLLIFDTETKEVSEKTIS